MFIKFQGKRDLVFLPWGAMIKPLGQPLTVDVHHFLHGVDGIGIGSLLQNLFWQRLKL